MTISAVIIIHNRANLVKETIISIFNQSKPVDEIVIIDDGSTDNLEHVLQQLNDSRIKHYYYNKIGIISKLRNLGIDRSNGDVIAFIDSDDLWHQNKIEILSDSLIKNNAVIALTDSQGFNANGDNYPSVCQYIKSKNVDLFHEIIDNNLSMAFGTNLFFKKYINGEIAYFDERLLMGEHDFILRYISSNEYIFINQVLNFIRRHDNNTTKEGDIYELTSHLEYNRTLKKLLDKNQITVIKYHKIKAKNYCKCGGYYLKIKNYKYSTLYFKAAIGNHFKWYYSKLLLKAYLLRILENINISKSKFNSI